MVQPFTHDTYAPLSYMEALGPGDGQTMPIGLGDPKGVNWLTYDDARRLVAYRILAAKRDNAGRYYLPQVAWTTDRVAGLTEVERIRTLLANLDEQSPAEKWREYGDPGLLVAQARSLLLGDSQEVVLPELEQALRERSDEEQGDTPGEESAELTRLREFDEYLTEWADAERLGLRILELEEHAVGNGDGVAALGWSQRLKRPRLRIFDPGFYFPDLTTVGDDEEYPTVVHLAWEEKRADGYTWMHRKTWRLVGVGQHPAAPGEAYAVPWSDERADRVCVYEIAEWRTDQLRQGETVYNLDQDGDKRATVLQEPMSLGVDFLPVVHEPNDAAGARHFGRSILLLVAQLLDDIAATDTDLQANSELVGSSPLVTKGAGGALEAGPGKQWNMPDGGDAKLLDTSRALLGLTGYASSLRSNLSVMSRLAEALLGRIQPNDVPSGYALELGFAPTNSLVREMRMVRDEKHPLLLKFALRLAQANSALPAGETPRALIALGGFLPADKAAAVKQVTEALKAHALSVQTGVRMLMDAGFPIEDAETEVERIRAEATEDLVRLVDAMGAEGMTLVRERLGIKGPALLPAPALPGTGDTGVEGDEDEQT